MIKEYIRPDSLEEALQLLQKKLDSRPIAGGSELSQAKDEYSVVDLQNCGLDYIRSTSTHVQIGSMTRLESIRNHFGEFAGMGNALAIEAARNVREQATIGGTLFATTGRSPLLTCLLGLDAELVWEPASTHVRLGSWLAESRSIRFGRLLKEIVLDTNVLSCFSAVGRSPLDTPVICTQLTIWSTNRMRLVIGGFGKTPTLILDGSIHDDLDVAIESALNESHDEWASSEYRIDVAKKLAKRSFTELIAQKEQK
jgi:CO/xanthine dehydrogenase FAD-binding subunit